MSSTAAAHEHVIGAVLDRWKSAVDAHRPEQVAACFTEDAVFQGLHPYGVGRPAVAEYYASQPLGMTAAYRFLETRQPAPPVLLGYLNVEFSFADRPTLPVFLGVVLQQAPEEWLISHYQVSRLG